MKQIEFAVIAIVLLVARCLVGGGATIGDALAIAAFCGLVGWAMFLDAKTVIAPDMQMKEDIQKLKDAVAGMKMGNLYAPKAVRS